MMAGKHKRNGLYTETGTDASKSNSYLQKPAEVTA